VKVDGKFEDDAFIVRTSVADFSNVRKYLEDKKTAALARRKQED
jgi:hypothetical protein